MGNMSAPPPSRGTRGAVTPADRGCFIGEGAVRATRAMGECDRFRTLWVRRSRHRDSPRVAPMPSPSPALPVDA
jgi:hypothetical protein